MSLQCLAVEGYDGPSESSLFTSGGLFSFEDQVESMFLAWNWNPERKKEFAYIFT